MPDEEIDYSKIAESIGNDLFGTGGEEPSALAGDPGAAAATSTAPETPPLTPAGATTTASPVPPPTFSMPKAWKKEQEKLWQSLQTVPGAHEYINTREQDMLKGLDMYSNGHKQWDELTKPFTPLLQQYPDVNPVQLLQTLMRNHLAIVQGTPEQKKALVQNLLKSYGVELGTGPAPDGGQGQSAQAQIPPEFLREIGSMRQEFTSWKQQEQQKQLAESTRIVEAFAADPKNKYFSEVQDDIMRFIQTGAANDLAGAYELACYANPAVRAKIIAETAAQTPPVKPAPTQLNGSAEGTPSTRKPKTMDDTIDEVVRKHYGPH